MRDGEILIVGAGPTGLAMAIEARRLGLKVRLIDRAGEPTQHSQALVVQARTLEQFERYDISHAAVARGRKLLRASIISEGKTILSFPFERIPSRYPFVLFLPQNDTEALLGEHLASLGGSVERGTEFLSLVDGPDGVNARLRNHYGEIEETGVPWLIGCDGAHSAVRDAVKTEFTGDAVGLTFFLGDLELHGPEVPSDELRIYLHQGDVVFIGRLTDKLYRVIVALHSEQGQTESTQPLTLADFQTAIWRCAGNDITATSQTWITRFHIQQRKANHYRIGNVFLAGDACHIHSPVAGQGMNTGIQDAANLVWKLAAVANGAPDRLLDSYEEERGAVGEALLRTTSRGLAAATSASPWVEELRDFVVSIAGHLPWIQRVLLGFVSETAINYRGSSIVKDCGGSGSLRAGDRMPNPDLHFHYGHVERLLDPLKTHEHLLLAVEGENQDRLRMLFPDMQLTTLSRQESSGPATAILTDELAHLLGSDGSILAIRPDGYIGFRGREEDLPELEEYAKLTGLGQHSVLSQAHGK